MELVHVSGESIEPGQVLRPYELTGRLREPLDLARRALDGDQAARSTLLTGQDRLRNTFKTHPEMQMVLMEVVFERVRAELAPALPSQLESAFCWPTLEMARWFQATYRPTGVIHRCLLTEGDAIARESSFVVGGVDLSARFDDAIRAVEQRGVRYWTIDAPHEYPEVLVRGTAIVAEVLPGDR